MAQAMKIAIVDDEQDMRQSISQWLALSGYDTETFASAEDALKALGPDYPGIVISDIKMPGMDGIEVARCIAESHGAAVVILTAFSQREFVDQAIEAGALAYLVKPFQRSELVPAVEIARARHREMRAITDQAQTLADRLEDRKTIDRARGVLMDEVGLSETDAFRFIQQAAMNERANMADVARQVLEDGRRPES